MIELGKRQTLTIVKILDFGAYLSDTTDTKNKEDDEENKVLLPKKELPSDIEVMDPLEVFVYRDSKDRLIATTRDPLIHLGETATLTVKDVNNVGAFLDWGLEKDLLLPYKEQKGRPEKGEEVSVALYVDKSKRLCATMWITKDEEKKSTYENSARKLLDILKENGGELKLGDKSSPEEIKSKTRMSKNEFKRASGNLYKRRLITVSDTEIKLIKKK